MLPSSAVMQSLGRRVWNAADQDAHELLESLLALPSATGLDVNFQHPVEPSPPLVQALRREHIRSFRLLLDHPLIDVNATSRNGCRPLHTCAGKTATSTVLPMMKMLCDRPDLDINALDGDNATPLWLGCFNNNLEFVRFLLAHASVGTLKTEVRAIKQRRSPRTWHDKTALEVAASSEIRLLLGAYGRDPQGTRFTLRKDRSFGFICEDVAADFASVILLSDDFLHGAAHRANPALRFLLMSARLPIELQMIVCHVRHGSAGQVVLTRDTEYALKIAIRYFCPH